jgi:hypothetical protein
MRLITCTTHPVHLHLIGLGINIWYFARRWKYMSGNISNAATDSDEVIGELDSDHPS